MSDTAQIIIAVLSTLGTIGAGAGIHLVQARKSRDAGVKSEDVQSQPPTPDPLDVFRSLIEDLSTEIQRLREDQLEDREQIRLTRADLKATREEISAEREVKWAAVAYIRRLHDWIAIRIQGSDDMPPVPEALASHVYPRGGYPRPANSPKS